MDPVTVFVNLPTGSTPEFSMSTDATVLDIKLRVQDAMGPTPIGMLDTYTLHTTRGATDGSLLLNNALSLAEAGIENESSVIFNRVGARVRRYYVCVSSALSLKHFVSFSSAFMCAFGVAENPTVRCARCYLVYDNDVHAAIRTGCCGQLLCQSCTPKSPAVSSPSPCWYCVKRNGGALVEGVASPLRADVVGRDAAVSAFVEAAAAAATVTKYVLLYCTACPLL